MLRNDFICLIFLLNILTISVSIADDTNENNGELIKQRLLELTSGKVNLRSTGMGENKHISTPDVEIKSDPMYPGDMPGADIDSATNEKYLQALREYYDYRVEGLKHRRQVFNWQLSSAKIIFVVVLLIVLTGLYFAWVQFHIGMTKLKRGKEDERINNSEFSASIEGGIKVSSPVLGVIILTISLAFFSLYLVFVYPIEDIF